MPARPVPSPYYRVSVKALVSDGGGRLLVVHNADGGWEIPGGGWEHGETLEECLARELQEELGVGLRRLDATHIYPCASFGTAGQAWLKLVLPAELASHEFEFGDGMQAARYVSATTFATLTMHPADCVLQEQARRFWPTTAA
jgi:8-oxo-dGTP pyrophosphatase MutT (NUDIX family)